MIDPHTLERGAFKQLLDLGMTPIVLIVIGVFTGVMRLFALIMNSEIKFGPHMRAFGAAVTAIIWGQLGSALILRTFDTGSISIGISIFLVLTGGELFSLYRISKDSKLITLLIIEKSHG